MASKGVNKAIILGRLGQDPEVRYTAGGSAVTNISVATSESWKDKNTGEARENTEWSKITAFGRLAEIIGDYLSKGSNVYIEGRLQTDKWQDKNGIDRYTTKIIAREMQMLDSKPSGNQPQQPRPQQPAKQPAPQQDMPVDDDLDGDIPF